MSLKRAIKKIAGANKLFPETEEDVTGIFNPSKKTDIRGPSRDLEPGDINHSRVNNFIEAAAKNILKFLSEVALSVSKKEHQKLFKDFANDARKACITTTTFYKEAPGIKQIEIALKREIPPSNISVGDIWNRITLLIESEYNKNFPKSKTDMYPEK